MKNKILNRISILLSMSCLIISLVITYNIAIYSDEFGSSPRIIFGGDFWLYMYWLQLFFLAVLVFVSIKNSKKK